MKTKVCVYKFWIEWTENVRGGSPIRVGQLSEDFVRTVRSFADAEAGKNPDHFDTNRRDFVVYRVELTDAVPVDFDAVLEKAKYRRAGIHALLT